MNCPKCGLEIQEGTTVCPSCGTPIAPSAEPQTNLKSEATDEPKVEVNAMETTLAIEAYLYLLVLAPLFGGKKSEFVKFHTNQGIILCAIQLIAIILTSVCSAIATAFIGGAFELSALAFVAIIPALVGGLFGLIFLATIVFDVLGILNVIKGKMKPLPLIGKYKILK